MNNIIDISVPLRVGMVRWPGSAPFCHDWTSRIEAGDGVNVSMISSDLHAGTHIDAPLHFLSGGTSVDELNLEMLCGPVQVVDLPGVSAVTADNLAAAGIRAETVRLLLKTDNSCFWGSDHFRSDFAALTRDGAQFLLEAGIRLVGIDYLSVQRYNDPPHVHRLLLEAGVILVEGLDLSRAASGCYELICLPLKIAGAEGALARAVLRELR